MIALYRRLCLVVILFLSILSPAYAAETAVQDVIVLCYHDVEAGNYTGEISNPYSVSQKNLRLHFDLLKRLGFEPISAGQYLEAKQGKSPLPEKAVMLTFDDGYKSFYTDVLPLLKEFNYPAVLAIVTSWEEVGPPQGVGAIVSWDQIREIELSGLVTTASHSHNMHNFVVNNPFGNRGQEGATLLYTPNGYETRDSYQKRLAGDMELTQRAFEKNLGHSAEIYVWPYGEYTKLGAEMAQAAGAKLLFTLGDDVDTKLHRHLGVNRTIIYNNPGEEEFLKLLNSKKAKVKPLKVGQLDIDLLYDESPEQFENNINAAIRLLKRSGANTVFLQSFADENGTGEIESVYFHTTAAPVKKDVFSHVVQRLQAEQLLVYAWMPTLACQWLTRDYPEDLVQATAISKKGWYNRATPFSPRVREELKALFRDLAAYSNIDGVLFQDDLYLNDFEDMSPAAKQVFKERFHRDLTKEILQNREIRQEWTKMKTEALDNLTVELMKEVQQYRPRAKVARNIYSNVVLTPEAQEWMAQDYEKYLKLYDYTVIMVYPFMEKVNEPNKWIAQLTQRALRKAGAADKTIFKLQSYDWETDKWIAPLTLGQEMTILLRSGALNTAYYPLNVYSDQKEILPFHSAEQGK